MHLMCGRASRRLASMAGKSLILFDVWWSCIAQGEKSMRFWISSGWFGIDMDSSDGGPRHLTGVFGSSLGEPLSTPTSEGIDNELLLFSLAKLVPVSSCPPSSRGFTQSMTFQLTRCAAFDILHSVLPSYLPLHVWQICP